MRAKELFNDKPAQAKQQAVQVGQGVPVSPEGRGLNPGGIEAIKQTILSLIQSGLELSLIVTTVMQMLQKAGINIQPEQVQQLVEQTAEGQEVVKETAGGQL